LRRNVPAAHVSELLDVIGAHVPRARLERHHVTQLRSGHLLCHHPNQRPVAIEDRRDHAIDDGNRCRDHRRVDRVIERAEQHGHHDAHRHPEQDLQRPQTDQSEQRAADDGDGQRLVEPDQAEQPTEQRHQQRAADDALPQRLHLGGAAAHARGRFGRRVQQDPDKRADAGPDAVDGRPEHRAGRRAQRSSPDQRVQQPASAAPPATVRAPHAAEYHAAA
jgi:hypothetical protein